MRTRIQSRGKHLAIPLPRSLAEKAGLHANSEVEVTIVSGALVVRPVSHEAITLKELLRGVTQHNLPGEWRTGARIGIESW
jgi:antitoxin component of MazEF toxin-antitoxin module